MANSTLRIVTRKDNLLTAVSTKAEVLASPYTIIDLLDARGWTVKDWRPAVAEPKSGGVFRSSALTDGRRLASRRFDNAIETFTMVLSSGSQDSLIFEL